MALFKIIDTVARDQIGVWKIEESLEDLILETKNGYVDELESFTNESRKKQYLASRLILQNILNQNHIVVNHDENGKPSLFNSNHHISISHTNKFVAVIISKTKKAGIDIEMIHPRIHKTRRRFVSESEEKWLKDSDFVDQQLFLIWGAKEAMLKTVGDRRIDFLKNMWVNSFDFSKHGVFESRMEYLEINKTYKVNYQQIEDHLLVYIVD